MNYSKSDAFFSVHHVDCRRSFRDADRYSRKRTKRHRLRDVAQVIAILACLLFFAGAAMSALNTETVPRNPKTMQYIVNAGDSLWNIAERFDSGRNPQEVTYWIMQHNGLHNAIVQPGQALLIPVGR